MKNKGRSQYTINNTNKFLTYLNKNCNLNNPQEVETFIANKTASNSYKKCLCIAYKKFCKKTSTEWKCQSRSQKPKPSKYRPKRNLK